MADEQALIAECEQVVFEQRLSLDSLHTEKEELMGKQKHVASQAIMCRSGVSWEERKQRYRHTLDGHGLRLVFLIVVPFAALVLPFSFVYAVFNNVKFGILAGTACTAGSMLAYTLILCGTDIQTKKKVHDYSVRQCQLHAAERENNVAIENNRLAISNAQEELAASESKLAKYRVLEEERKKKNAFEIRASNLWREPWRNLRGVAFERFIACVFKHLGYQIEETPVSGDQGVDLIVFVGERRIAVQVKGYADAVSNSAIQEVVAGMKFHRCSSTCVVTNSRFTKSALQLASANDCFLVQEANFEDFVFGRLFQNG